MPANADKFRFLTLFCATKVSDPAVTVKDTELASEVAPPLNVRVPTAPEYEASTTALPVTVKLVDVLVFQIATPSRVAINFPDAPKAIVLALELVDENAPAVKDWLLMSKVPLVSVTVRVDPVVRLSANCHAPPTPLNVRLLFKITPLLVKTLDEVPSNVTTPV